MACTPRESYQSYKTLNQFQLSSPKSKVVELEHKKSGASIVLIKNSDPAKTFTATFRTPPYDDSGLFHIFEHSVLAGSRLYPSKSGFFNIGKSSVASFINAMTSDVSTFYPFITKNHKDFENLLSFYMDAVYFPKKDPRIIKREGWRYEVDPKTKKMSINGVVFSEMKGAFSNPYRALVMEIDRNLLPQTPYSFESGGLPEKISGLSYDQIVQAHKKYYHPQNSLIFLYGDIDYKKILSKIDREFLDHFTKSPDFSTPSIPLQKNLKYPKSMVMGTYPGTKGKNKDFLVKAYTLGPLDSLERDLATLLIQALISKTSSPLRLRILKEGLAQTVFHYTSGELNNVHSFCFEGTTIENQDKIEKIIQEEMDKISKDGFDPELLTSILNQYEFHYKSKFSNGARLGSALMYSVGNYWLFKEETLEKSLDFMGFINDLRKKLNDTAFVKSFFEKHFKKSSQFRWLAMEPDPLFSKKFNSGIEKQIQEALKLKPLSEYEKESADFKKWVAEKEPPQILDKIPRLKLSDIGSDDEGPVPFHQSKMDSTELIQYPQQTSGISYIDLFFDLRGVKEENLKKLSFFTNFLKKTNTKNYSFEKISKLIDIYTGGVSFSLQNYQSVKDPQKFKPTLYVSLKFLDQNLDKTMELLNELMTNSEFTPEDRVEKLVNETKINMANSISSYAQAFAFLSVYKSFFPLSGGFLNETEGGDFGKFILDLKPNPKELTVDLKSILKNVFNRDRLYLVTMTSREEKLKELKTKVEKLRSSLPKTNRENQNWLFKNQKNYNAFSIPGEVQYVYEGGNLKEQGLEFNGTMKVLSNYLNLQYMTPKLREQAGAYGGGISFNKNGLFMMSSYRDPNLKKTFETFSKTADFIKNKKIDQKDLDPIILGSLKPYYLDKSIKEKTSFMTRLYLTDQTWDDYINIKKEILETKPESFEKIINLLSKASKKSKKAVAGNPEKLRKEAPFLKEVLPFQ